MQKSDQLVELDSRHYLHPVSAPLDNFERGPLVIMNKGEGIYLEDCNGQRYMDGTSSLWNVNIGHGRQEIITAVTEQMKQLAYSHSFNRFSHQPVIQLAKKIASLTPGDLNICFFTSGGSEANDTAFKLARYYYKLKGEPQRYKIIARHRAFHGLTIAATSATGIPVFREMVGSSATGFLHASTPYCYRCDVCKPECTGECAVESVREIIEREGAKTVAAIIVEPIQGAGGVLVPPAGYMQKIREICDQHGILLIADEIITGFGRTGKWFGMEHENVVPDMLTFAKGVTSGYIPLGGVAISERIFNGLLQHPNQLLPHGFTYSGHPTACAVALANIEIISREGLVENAARMGDVLRQGLEQFKQEMSCVGNVMSRGLVASVEIVQDKDSKTPFSPAVKVAHRIFEKALENGLTTRPISIDQTDIIALSPPLIINEQQIEKILTILKSSILEVMKDLS